MMRHHLRSLQRLTAFKHPTSPLGRLSLRLFQYGLLLLLGSAIFMAITMWAGTPHARAFPEYAIRTGESCGTCHVDPGGGGPRTLRGLLWTAQGRPDSVPGLPAFLIAPGVTNGAELYDIACAGCHGALGEGSVAQTFIGTGISEDAIRSIVTRGLPVLGMPAFQEQLSAEQLEVLVAFTARLASGEEQLQSSFSLPPPALNCRPVRQNSNCQAP